jgi:hypothetical protein
VTEDQFAALTRDKVEMLYHYAVGKHSDQHGVDRKTAAAITIDMLVQALGALSVPFDAEGKMLLIESLVESMNRGTACMLARETIREAARHDN